MTNFFIDKILPMMLLSLVSFLIGWFVMLWFQRGFLITYLKVRFSRGKNILLWVITPRGEEAKLGKVKGETARYKIDKEFHTIDVSDRDRIYRALGVNNIRIRLGDPKPLVAGSYDRPPLDSNTLDNIIVRVLSRPVLGFMSKEMRLILIVLFIVGIISLYIAWNVPQILSVVQELAGRVSPAVVP